MTILSVVQQVSSVIGVMRPQALFPSAGSDRTARELADLAVEMAQRIAYDTRDWQALIASTTFVGDGAAEAFPLPANYKRLLLDGNVWRSTSAMQPMRFIPSADEWLQRRLRGYNGAWGEWSIFGGVMHIRPVMGGGGDAWHTLYQYLVGTLVYDPDDRTVWRAATQHVSAATGSFAQDRDAYPGYWIATGAISTPTTASFTYLDKNCVALASGGRGDAFMNDLDTFVLDERLLKLAMIWQWKANKGSPYAEDMANYQDALANIAGADRPAPILIDRLPISAAAQVAYPFPIVLGPGGAPI